MPVDYSIAQYLTTAVGRYANSLQVQITATDEHHRMPANSLQAQNTGTLERYTDTIAMFALKPNKNKTKTLSKELEQCYEIKLCL